MDKKNPEEAVKWYEKAAKQGHAKAQVNLGLMYANGDDGVEKDSRKAVTLWKLAAEQGNAKAQLNLGVMYSTGEGVDKKNPEEAVKWYEKAAEQENAKAQLNLGLMYANCDGVEKDYAKARELWEKAAKQGNGSAHFNLGVLSMGVGSKNAGEKQISEDQAKQHSKFARRWLYIICILVIALTGIAGFGLWHYPFFSPENYFQETIILKIVTVITSVISGFILFSIANFTWHTRGQMKYVDMNPLFKGKASTSQKQMDGGDDSFSDLSTYLPSISSKFIS